MADLNDPESMKRKLQESINYLASPDFTIVYNHERVNIKEFGKKTISQESSTSNFMFDPRVPSWLHSKIYLKKFEDESLVVNLGLTDDKEYLDWSIAKSYPSSWVEYPNRYKFSSI